MNFNKALSFRTHFLGTFIRKESKIDLKDNLSHVIVSNSPLLHIFLVPYCNDYSNSLRAVRLIDYHTGFIKLLFIHVELDVRAENYECFHQFVFDFQYSIYFLRYLSFDKRPPETTRCIMRITVFASCNDETSLSCLNYPLSGICLAIILVFA